MDIVIEFIKILLPAALVLYAMYLTMRSLISKELHSKTIDYKSENVKIILPLRLQAYERMCLFLERISPGNLLPRLNEPGLSAKAFQSIITSQVREELSHNLSQQVYMSSEAWDLIKKTCDEVISMVNIAAEKTGSEAKSTDLAKEIVSLYVAREVDPINYALNFVKDEIRQQF